jgi:hypothetical protein
MARAGMDRGAGVALDRQRRHTVVAEQHRGGQVDQAAADDQDRDFLVGHGATLARAHKAQKRHRVAPYGSAVATPNAVPAVTRNRCHGGGPALGAL